MNEITGPQLVVIIYGLLTLAAGLALHGERRTGVWDIRTILVQLVISQWFFWYIGVWQ